MKDEQHFAFGDPEPVLKSQITDYLGVWLLDNGRYFGTPVPFPGLARLLRANAYHGPILEFKTNVVMRGFNESKVLKAKHMRRAATDYNVFCNAYFQIRRNWFNEVVELVHLPAINMRRMKAQDTYGMLDASGKMTVFEPGEVYHLKNYDVSQTIYGLPSYIGAIQSMLLNEDATLFRRRYYKNGAHMGYIFYTSGPIEDKFKDKIEGAIEGSKGLGNFKNLYLHLADGQEGSVKIIPVGDFSTKDEMERIKNLSRDDMIAAHRIPPALAAIIPTNNGGFGDITKIDEVYEKNEVKPVRDLLIEVNEILPQNAWVSFDSKSEIKPES